MIVYSDMCVMQSDGNSYIGDVVLNNFNMPYSDEDSNLDPKFEKQIFCALFNEDFKLLEGLKKSIYKEIQHITTRNS